MEWELLSFVKRSKQRIQILMSFKSSETPSEIAKRTNLAPSHITRTLKEFVKMGLLKCENPKDKIGKLYTLTERGQEIQDILKGGEIADVMALILLKLLSCKCLFHLFFQIICN